MRLVVGYLATPGGADALALAVRFARTWEAEVEVCIVLPPDTGLPALVPKGGFEDVLAEQAQGWLDEALAIYRDIVTRMPGEEARCRYAALLLDMGRKREAQGVLEEVEGRMKRLDSYQRRADAAMYRWAADKLRELRAG